MTESSYETRPYETESSDTFVIYAEESGWLGAGKVQYAFGDRLSPSSMVLPFDATLVAVSAIARGTSTLCEIGVTRDSTNSVASVKLTTSTADGHVKGFKNGLNEKFLAGQEVSFVTVAASKHARGRVAAFFERR